MRNIKGFDSFAINESEGAKHIYIVGDSWQEAFAYDVFDNDREAFTFMEDMVEEKFEEKLRQGEIEIDFPDPDDYEDEEEYEEEYEEAREEGKKRIREDLFLAEYELSNPKKVAEAFDMILGGYYFGALSEKDTCNMIKKAVAYGADVRHMELIDSMDQEHLFDQLEEISKDDPETQRILSRIPGLARTMKSKKLFGI